MNPLQRALIEKTGHDDGFEYVLPDADAPTVALASAWHGTRALVALSKAGGFAVVLQNPVAALLSALQGKFQAAATGGNRFALHTEAQLPPGLGTTEVERLVRQRLQAALRSAMLVYWGGACVLISFADDASLAGVWPHCASRPAGAGLTGTTAPALAGTAAPAISGMAA